MGNLVFQATLGGQVNLVGPNTASTFNLNVPAVSSTLSTTSGTETLTNKTLTNPVINGFTGDTSVVNIGSGQLYKDTAGNLGLGVTPSAWQSTRRALQVGATSSVVDISGNTYFGNNYYNDSSGTAKYIANGVAFAFGLESDGGYKWYRAGSGTAGGTISFTQAMTLNASGSLGLATTTPYGLLSANIGITSSGSGNPSAWDNTYAVFGNSGASQGAAVGIGFAGGGIITSVAPATAWQPLKYFAANHIWYIAGSQAATIDTSGNLLVGTTSKLGNSVLGLQVNSSDWATTILTSGAGGNGLCSLMRRTASTGEFIAFQYSNTPTGVGSISTNGTSTTYGTSSDYRLKNSIVPMTGALAKVAALKPVTYKWNADDSEGEGFIAHELAEVCPQAVTGEKDAVDEDGNPKYQGIDTSFLVATLTAALQEMKAIIDDQAARIAALEAK